MPLSEKQLAANRANHRKSRSPVTSGGLRNSSRNALKYGMFAQTIIALLETLSHLEIRFDRHLRHPERYRLAANRLNRLKKDRLNTKNAKKPERTWEFNENKQQSQIKTSQNHPQITPKPPPNDPQTTPDPPPNFPPHATVPARPFRVYTNQPGWPCMNWPCAHKPTSPRRTK
jgi:hypothetical protein